MANYSIVLNLRGSAVTNSKKLADNLERADKAAKSLKGNLQGMPNVPTGGRGGYYGGVGGGRPTYGSSMGNGLVSAVTTLSTQSGLGTVFRFAGQLNTALAVTDAIFRTAAQAVKIGAKFNIMAYTGGAQLLKKGADILTSSQMGEGIRLLQRRQQARLGFGAGYAEAQERADLLAASYGLDPSNVIASMNVLAGMKVGGRKISTAQAERLTQVGGLIAQQSGMSFETVMINIQQMMSQAVPSMRDIRQLLTHAPILGRYALQEMEKKGITGMTAMEYLKADKGGLMAVFERYLSENPAILTMRARGVAQRAQTGFYATLAENPAWLTVAGRYSNVMDVAAKSLSRFLTSLTESDALATSITSFTVLMEKAPDLVDKVVKALDPFIARLYKIAGLPLGDVKGETIARREQERWVSEVVSANLPEFIETMKAKGIPLQASSQANEILLRDIIGLYGGAGKFVTTQYPLSDLSLTSQQFRKAYPAEWSRLYNFFDPNYVGGSFGTRKKLLKQRATAEAAVNPLLFMSEDWAKTGYGAGLVSKDAIHDAIRGLTPELLTQLGLGGSPSGEAISGYGSDRKSLTINFNAPIVEWDSTINADDPQDVVNTVTETIEGAASRAIQIALLGATGTMSSRY